MDWTLIDNLQDDNKIYTGVCIRFYNTPKSFAERCSLPCGKDNCIEYIMTEVYGNSEYFQLICLTGGEAGNISCVLRKENGNHFVTGKEIKRMLQTDLYKILINTQPKIVIE